MRAHSTNAGFSLLELMIVVSITAILAAVAIPSFRTVILDAKRTTTVNDLMASLQLARGEAAKLGQPVVVCPSNSSGTACINSTSWSGGWLMYANTDTTEPPAFESTDRILQLAAAVSSDIVITSSASSFVFRPFGSRNTNGNFKFCDPRGSGHAKSIIVNTSGRARLSDVSSSGSALTCS